MPARRRGNKPRELFLSHSSRDGAFATKLAATLQRHGVPVWYSKTHIRGGQEWHDEIGRALDRCDWFAVLLSPASVKATWVKRETVFALGSSRYRERIVPVLHRPCQSAKLSWTLDALQRVDFTKRFEDGCKNLLALWGLKYRP